jgi:catalase
VTSQPVRYHWEPEAGTGTLSDGEEAGLDPDFLATELAGRLARGPAAFTLWLTLPEPGDPLDDPTALWPDRRRQVAAGRLELTATSDTDALIFDPILHARSGAYGVSFERRQA